MSLNLETDAQLILRIVQSDTQAFECLYKRYFSKLYAAAFKRLQNSDVCQEILQDLFVNLWDRRQKLNIDHVEAYLFTSIKYLVIAQYKKNSLFEQYINQEIRNDQNTNFTEELMSFDELNNEYQQALLLLPERCRMVFVLSRSGLSQREISEKLDISEKTVENQKTKAFKILREALKAYL